MNFQPEEREMYKEHLKWLRVEANTLKKNETKGFEKGLEKASCAIAINPLNPGMFVKRISEVTGLSKSVLEKT